MELPIFIFQLAVLIFSIMIHEISHGAVAYYLGDDTAKQLGRLTLNPLKHLDPIGSVVLPLVLAIPLLFGAPSIIVGWAKPVPFNPLNLKNPPRDSTFIALAGPFSNIFLAVTFAILLKLAQIFSLNPALILAFNLIIVINLILAFFNLVPIPPLDGSKLLFYILGRKRANVINFLERNSLLLLLLFIIFGFSIIRFLVGIVYVLLTSLLGISVGNL